MNKHLREKLKNKRNEMININKQNKSDIEILNKYISPKRVMTKILSFALIYIIMIIIISTITKDILTMQSLLRIIGFLISYIVSNNISNIITDKITYKNLLKNIKYNGKLLDIKDSKYLDKISPEIIFQKEIEIENNNNLLRVISKVQNNENIQVKDEKKESLLNDKKSIKVLSTKKILKQNYNKVNNVTSKKNKVLLCILLGIIGLLFANSLFLPNLASILIYPYFATIFVGAGVMLNNIKKLSQKKALEYINSSLDEDKLTKEELSDDKTDELDLELNNVINRISNNMCNHVKDENNILNNNKLKKENNYSYETKLTTTEENHKTLNKSLQRKF